MNGASESVLRGLASTEIYLKKVRKTVSKMMRLQWTSELDIDALEAKGHWATLAEEQSTISEDQKHSSVIARVHYQKQRSREVASKAHEYLERLHGKKGSELEIDVRSRLSGNSASSEDQNGSKTDISSNDEGETIAETPPERLSGVPRLKRENAFIVTDFPARKKSLMFTPEEDSI